MIKDGIDVQDGSSSHFQKLFDERTQSNLDAYVDGRKEPYQAYVYQDRLRRVLKMCSALNLAEGAAVLDAGCGANPLIHSLAGEGYFAIGFDLSLEMLRGSREVHSSTSRLNGASNVGLCQASLIDFPFRSDSFDLVVCLGVLAYVPTDERALSEINRVLKLGGSAVIAVRQKYNLPAFLDVPELIRRRLKRLRKYGAVNQVSPTPDEPLARYHSMSKFMGSAREAGLRVEAVEGMRYGPLHLFGRRFLPSAVDIAISKVLGSISFFPGLRQLGLWQIVQLRKQECKE